MRKLVVDASVWVSAADPSDCFHASSRKFLTALVRQRVTVVVPAIAHLEVGCALSRRLHDPQRGRALADELLCLPLISVIALDSAFLDMAVTQGTRALLRAADALYAAATGRTEATLVAWDRELVERADGLTPDGWMDAIGFTP